jgi:hypothetical protein
MITRQIGDSVASKALEGQSITALRRAARDNGKAAAKESLKASPKSTGAAGATRKTRNIG